MRTPKFGAGSILENYMEIFMAKNSTESLKQVDYVNIARFETRSGTRNNSVNKVKIKAMAHGCTGTP